VLKVLLNALNDITTTPEAAPQFSRIANRPAYNPQLATRQKMLYPVLQPLHSPLAPHDLFAKAVDAAKRQSQWEIIFLDATHYRIEATAATPLLKFRDDVVIEVRAEGAGGSSLHMRSRSRLGRNDFSANYKRIQGFLDLLK